MRKTTEQFNNNLIKIYTAHEEQLPVNKLEHSVTLYEWKWSPIVVICLSLNKHHSIFEGDHYKRRARQQLHFVFHTCADNSCQIKDSKPSNNVNLRWLE
jgi:hypothetical protein